MTNTADEFREAVGTTLARFSSMMSDADDAPEVITEWVTIAHFAGADGKSGYILLTSDPEIPDHHVEGLFRYGLSRVYREDD